MAEIQGFVSRKTIREWLDNYQALAAQDVMPDAIPGNTGPKAYDGVSGAQMNKVMLDEAIQGLPPRIRACAVARWVKRWEIRCILVKLKISRDVYYIRCNQAVDLIFIQLNGTAINYKNLVNEIKKGLTFPPTKG